MQHIKRLHKNVNLTALFKKSLACKSLILGELILTLPHFFTLCAVNSRFNHTI